MIFAIAAGFIIGFTALAAYGMGHGVGYCKGRNDYIEALEWVLINDPVARRDLLDGLAEKEAADARAEYVDGQRRAAEEGRN